MIVSFNIQIDSDIDFKTVKIDDLTDENCVFLDEQNKDVLKDQVEAIKARTDEVINRRLIDLGIIEDETTEEPAASEQPTSIDIKTLKEEAKNKIINSVSEAMTVAQNEGREYTLNDLIDLNIPDSEFTVSIEGDEAILNVDGFEFKLDSSFQLYEE